MKQTVYIETTIPSLLTAWPSRDAEIAVQQTATREWWEKRRQAFATQWACRCPSFARHVN